jgi:hypothetical protein
MRRCGGILDGAPLAKRANRGSDMISTGQCGAGIVNGVAIRGDNRIPFGDATQRSSASRGGNGNQCGSNPFV